MSHIFQHLYYLIDDIEALLTEALCVDSILKQWTVGPVDSSFGVLRNVLPVPNHMALQKKCQQNHQTFHDGVLAMVVGTGAESLILKWDMCNEMERYMLFLHKNWPSHAPVSSSCCMGRMNNWDHGDTAMGEHQRLYPKCKFIRGTDQRNVPYSGLVEVTQKGTDIKLRPKSGVPSSSRNETCGPEDDSARILKPLYLQELKPAKTLDGFKGELNHLLFFSSWPITSPVNCYDLIATGLFCVNDTTVKCLACCGRIFKWRHGDRLIDVCRTLFLASPFTCGHWTGNVHLSGAKEDQAIEHFAQTTAQESEPHQMSPNVYDFQNLYGGRYGHTTHHLQLIIPSEPTELTVRYPEYPLKVYEQLSLETFSQWPQSHNQIPANLSRAGIFATAFPAEVCYGNQTAELGRQGSIICHFPDGWNEVHWIDSSDTSHTVITYKPNTGEKSGPGLDSGAYDVHEDGSLIITNVSTLYERSYQALVYLEGSLTPVTYIISLKVVASPVDDLPVISCHNCYQDYYYIAMQGDILSCSFNATRPPVQLEWFRKSGDAYEHLEMQQFNTTENSNGTYNSLATVHLLKGKSNVIQLLVCRATWPLSDWSREREILLDSSSNVTFFEVSPTVQHMEISRYAQIQCGQSPGGHVVWKRILPNSGPEIIGFLLHGMTETISDIPDVEVSAEGSLIFASPRVHHEGIYVCIYRDGQKEEIQMTSVEILIPPSPPYIQITGCDVSHRCVIRENRTKALTCAVRGARPIVTLEWIAEDEDVISFAHYKVDFNERGETFDTILSVEYKVAPDVLCEEEIVIKCHLKGPLSNVMKAESIASVIPASCMEYEVKHLHGLGVIIALMVLIVLMVVILICLIIFRRSHLKTRERSNPNDHTDVPLKPGSWETTSRPS